MSDFLKKLFHLNPFLISVVLIVLLVFLYLVGPRFLEVLELKALDLRFLLRGPKAPGGEVVIAVIDEKSVDEIGRWPWPRSRIAETIKALADDGALSIAFDIGFFEPDINTNLELIQKLGDEVQRLGLENQEIEDLLSRERRLADNDRILAETIKNVQSPVVLGYFFHMQQDETVAHITEAQVEEKIERLKDSHYTFMRLSSPNVELTGSEFSKAFMPEANIPELHETADAAGYFNMFPDSDGVVRWVPMTIQCRDKFYMPLSLQGLRLWLGGVPASVTVSELGVESASVGHYDLPTNELGQLLVNYRGPSRTFPHHSIADIVAGRLPPGTFKDKLVLVGATAVGIYDLRVTPFDSVFPGIEIHANVIDNIIHQDFLVRPGWAAILDVLSILVIGLVLALMLPKLSALTGPVLALVLVTASTGGNYLAFTKGIWINVTYPILTVLLVYTGITVYRYMTEEREKRWIKGAFNSYVNPSLVSEMLKNPDMLKLGGDKKIATVLFSDIRGFTTISEKMDAEKLTHLLNRYLTVMTDIVFKYNGLLDKYIGDAVMAVWGAPLPDALHARRACLTSLEMMEGLARFREELAQEDENSPYLDIGIGVNTGLMVVGNLGSEVRMDYTAIGDSVNLASRLEGTNKQYGTHIIVGEITFEQVKEDFYCRELDSVAVKGKELPVRIFELLGEKEKVTENTLKMARAFQRGLVAYKRQRWDQARKVFSALQQYFPEDQPTRLYLERVTELKRNPPGPDWNGVFVMKTK
ncbi:MAG: adenylate/guanylate cyclase domain-containing protein [Thermodesulfobacteriota bacterium]